MKELKKCPFCGSEVEWCKDNHTVHDLNQDCHYITCKRCGEFNLNCIDSLDFPKLYDSIADQWNMRASVDLSKLEEFIEYSRCSLDRACIQKLIDENSND